jgi:hypothetical protein
VVNSYGEKKFMAHESSATWRSRVIDKYGREPFLYFEQGQRYEDMEFARSKMHEDGGNKYLVANFKEQQDSINTRMSRVISNMNKDG